MVFTLTITDPQTRLIFSDLFIMNSELEFHSKFKFLGEKQKHRETQNAYFLEIKTLTKTLIEVSTDSMTQIQNLKAKIYDVLIEKVEADTPYHSPGSNLSINSTTNK